MPDAGIEPYNCKETVIASCSRLGSKYNSYLSILLREVHHIINHDFIREYKKRKQLLHCKTYTVVMQILLDISFCFAMTISLISRCFSRRGYGPLITGRLSGGLSRRSTVTSPSRSVASSKPALPNGVCAADTAVNLGAMPVLTPSRGAALVGTGLLSGALGSLVGLGGAFIALPIMSGYGSRSLCHISAVYIHINSIICSTSLVIILSAVP